MRKVNNSQLKNIFLLVTLTCLVSTTNIAFAERETNAHAKINWSFVVIQALIGATFTGLIGIATNPEILRIIIKYFNKKYAQEIQLEQFRIINESLKTQLDYLRVNCKDKNIIKAVEDQYLKSCIQIMELQKKYLEIYANPA